MPARATPRRHVEHGTLAGLHAGHSGPDGLDNRGALVPQDDRQAVAPLAVCLADVRVADARANDPDEHLTRAGIPQAHLLDPLGLAEGVEDGGACLQ